MSGCPAKKIITVGAVIAIIALLFPFSVSCSKPPAPIAAFSIGYVSGERLIGDPITGLAPLTIQFNDSSSGKITSWRWSLGDGTVVEGSGEEARDFVHIYQGQNNGYRVDLKVTGPGGTDTQTEWGIVAVLSCSEAANSELKLARDAIDACMQAAGKTQLDSDVVGWDGSRGKVTAGKGSRDAADYLDIWKTFKAAYDVDGDDGSITSGTDVSWGCIYWNPNALGRARWTKIGG
jgi:PKD repeat protein